MRKTLLTLLLSAAALAGGCRSTTPKSPPISELPANSLRTHWTRTLEMKGESPKAIYLSGDSLFVYRSDNLLYRINRDSGALIFVSNAAPKGEKVGVPLVSADGIYIPSDTKIHIVDARGFRSRSIDLKQPMRSGMVGDKGGIYVGLDVGRAGGRLACLDLDRPDAPLRWQLLTGGTVVSTPALHAGILYAGSDDGKVYAVDSDRAPAWAISTFQTGGPIHGDISADASGVYVASADTKLYCLDPGNGRIRWQYYSGIPLFDSPAVTKTSVYINVRDAGMVCLDKAEGEFNRKAKWTVPEARGFLAEDDKLTYLRGKHNTILAVDRNTGVLKAQSQRADLVAFAVNTRDGLVYAATKSGEVFAAVAVTKPGAVGEMVFAGPSAIQLSSR